MEDLVLGACLPKDSNAFIKYANQIEKQLNVLNNVIKLNNDIRSSNEETKREVEQILHIKEMIFSLPGCGIVDIRDLKSLDSNIVPVQVRPRHHKIKLIMQELNKNPFSIDNELDFRKMFQLFWDAKYFIGMFTAIFALSL